MNFRENFKKDMKKCDHHIADLRKQLTSRFAAVEKVRGIGRWAGGRWGLLEDRGLSGIGVGWGDSSPHLRYLPPHPSPSQRSEAASLGLSDPCPEGQWTQERLTCCRGCKGLRQAPEMWDEPGCASGPLTPLWAPPIKFSPD